MLNLFLKIRLLYFIYLDLSLCHCAVHLKDPFLCILKLKVIFQCGAFSVGLVGLGVPAGNRFTNSL